MEIGLLGGSFNPPHLGHLILAEQTREEFHLDEIRWIPAAQPPHKLEDGDLVSARHRLAMTRLATAPNDCFSVSEIEIDRSGPSYTVDTVREFQVAEPDAHFFLIMGSDSLVDLPGWHKPETIIDAVDLLVYQRPGIDVEDVPTRFRNAAQWVHTPLIGISGTDIRDRCRQDRSVRYLVPDPVRSYIEKHRLYGAG